MLKQRHVVAADFRLDSLLLKQVHVVAARTRSDGLM